MALALLADRIACVRARDGFEQDRGIAHGARHRAHGVPEHVERHHAVETHESMRNPQADDAIDRRRRAHRNAGIGAQAHHREIRRHRNTGSTGRSTRCIRGVVGVADIARRARVDAVETSVRELRERGLGDQDAAGLAHACYRSRIALGLEVRERCRAARRRQVAAVDVVLGDERNAVQRAAELAGFPELRIERIGLRERLLVDGDDRIEHRPLLIVGLDAREIGRGDFACRGRAFEISRLDLLDGGLLDREIGASDADRQHREAGSEQRNDRANDRLRMTQAHDCNPSRRYAVRRAGIDEPLRASCSSTAKSPGLRPGLSIAEGQRSPSYFFASFGNSGGALRCCVAFS